MRNFKLQTEQCVGLSIGNAVNKLIREENHKKSRLTDKKTPAKQNNSNIKIFYNEKNLTMYLAISWCYKKYFKSMTCFTAQRTN